MNHRTIDRTSPNHNPENSRGYFVQNRHGATVAGPFPTMHAAWAEQEKAIAEYSKISFCLLCLFCAQAFFARFSLRWLMDRISYHIVTHCYPGNMVAGRSKLVSVATLKGKVTC